MQNYIYGAGGHGKVVLDAMRKSGMSCAGFIDDRELLNYAGLQVFNASHLINKSQSSYVHFAIGNNKIRAMLAQKLLGMTFFNVVHPMASIAEAAKIGSGCLIAAQSVLGPDAVIGSHCIINHAAVVDHDCTVRDFTHIAPNANLGGGVSIGARVLVGTGAIVLPGLTVGDDVVIGAGAVVTKNISDGVTVVGSPARSI